MNFNEARDGAVAWKLFSPHCRQTTMLATHHSIFHMVDALLNQATGYRYASQHIWCLSQARINWEGCGRKGIWRKNGGIDGVGLLIRLDGVASTLIVSVSVSYYLSEQHEVQEMLSYFTGSPGWSWKKGR